MLRRYGRFLVCPANVLFRLVLLCLVCFSILPTPAGIAANLVAATANAGAESLDENELPGRYVTVAKARVVPFAISGRISKQDWHAGHGDMAICILYVFSPSDEAAERPDATGKEAGSLPGLRLKARAPPA